MGPVSAVMLDIPLLLPPLGGEGSEEGRVYDLMITPPTEEEEEEKEAGGGTNVETHVFSLLPPFPTCAC